MDDVVIPVFLFQTQTFDFVLKILSELPTTVGHWMPVLSSNNLGRHLILLPLTKRAVLQYCTKMVVNAFKVSEMPNEVQANHF